MVRQSKSFAGRSWLTFHMRTDQSKARTMSARGIKKREGKNDFLAGNQRCRMIEVVVAPLTVKNCVDAKEKMFFSGT